MTIHKFNQGACQAVLTEASQKFVYKVPLTRRYDEHSVSISFRPRALYKSYLMQRRYYENIKRFHHSVKLLKKLCKLSDNNLQRFLPATELLHVEGVEHNIGQKTVLYSGPVIKQEMVENFFGNDICLDSFDWEDLATIQIELWRLGVGIGAPAETWGPKNWGLTRSGKVRLVDTSHITEDFQQIMNLVSSKTFEKRKMQVLRQNKTSSPDLIERYFTFMKQHISPDCLLKNWKRYIQA